MSGFEGWWVDGRTGKGYHVSEHWMEVKSDPERFGLTDDIVKKILKSAKGKFSMGDTSAEGQRGKLLIAAMKNGWVRVRGFRSKYSIQLTGNCASKLKKVLPFLHKAGVGPYSEVLVNDLATGYTQRFEEGMGDVRHALRAGQIPDAGIDGEPDESPIKGITPFATDKQKRVIMRQRIGRTANVPDPQPKDDYLEEKKSLAKGFKKLLG